MGPDEKPVVVVKAPLAKIIRNPNHLTIYQVRVNRVNRLFGYHGISFSRYIFVHSYDDDDAFNADTFMMDSFFMEVLRSLQTGTRKAAKTEDVLRNRQLIDKYLEAFY